MSYALVRRRAIPGTVQTHGTQLSSAVRVASSALHRRPPLYGHGYLGGTVTVGDPAAPAARVVTVIDVGSEIVVGKTVSDAVTGAWHVPNLDPLRTYHARVDDEPGGPYESDFSSRRTPEPMP